MRKFEKKSFPGPAVMLSNLCRNLPVVCFISLFFLTGLASAQDVRNPDASRRLGGDHEFGIVAGYSPISGPVWGYSQDVRYAPIILRYSFLIDQWRYFALRYGPEVTALAVLHENVSSETNPFAPMTAFASGVSIEGFRLEARPLGRVQPFLSHAGGFTYYNHRVLSPQGSQWMYTIDFGTGVNVFMQPRNALTFGFRYQHLSNANISLHNPGTDANTFYIGISHFRTRGVH